MTNLTCNLTDGSAQSPSYDTPPVLTAFGDGPLCECHVKGSWDFDRAIAEKPEVLVRSVRRLRNARVLDKWSDLIGGLTRSRASERAALERLAAALDDVSRESFLSTLRTAGGKHGNKSLRETLGWDEPSYEAIKNSLQTEGLVIPGRGLGAASP